MSQPCVGRFAPWPSLRAALVATCAALAALGGCAVPGTRSDPEPPLPAATGRTGSLHNPPTAAVADGRPSPSAPAQRPLVRQQAPAPDDELLGMDIGWLRDLSPAKAWARIRQKTPWRHDEERARALLREGEDLFAAGNYPLAAARFKSAARKWPDSTIKEDALFMLGECQFFLDQYPRANDTYSKLLKKYTNSRHLDRIVYRQFNIARYWQELERAKPGRFLTPNLTDRSRPWFDADGNAQATYLAVWQQDSTGPLADDALMATANAYFVKDRFQDADYYYTLLRKEYPQSEHLMQAYLLGLRSKLRSYQGPMHDSSPLVEAEELVDQMLTQFPYELGEEVERVRQARSEIHEQLAQRDWAMAEYYGGNKYHGAERYYIEKIIDEHPETSFGALAQQRLGEVREYPAEPPQRLKWLLSRIPGENLE